MTPRDDQSCFTDFALQEYVQDRLDPDVRAEVDAHCAACAECRRALESLRAECELLQTALSLAPLANEPMDASDTETLARYLDGALDPHAAEALEDRLAAEPRLLRALVRLQSEVAASVMEQGTGVRVPAPEVRGGLILRMPKRVKSPTVISAIHLKFGGGSAS